MGSVRLLMPRPSFRSGPAQPTDNRSPAAAKATKKRDARIVVICLQIIRIGLHVKRNSCQNFEFHSKAPITPRIGIFIAKDAAGTLREGRRRWRFVEKPH